jgi:hypothetical protein
MQAQPQSVWNYISRESSDVLDRFPLAKPNGSPDLPKHGTCVMPQRLRHVCNDPNATGE